MSPKKIRAWFLRQGSKSKSSNCKKKNLKDILNNVKSNYKVQATELFQFQLSSMKYEHLKPKNADILEIKGQLKKVHCAKNSSNVFLSYFLGYPQKNALLRLLTGSKVRKVGSRSM